MPRSTQVPTAPISVSDTGLSPAMVWLSSQLLLPNHGSRVWVLQPRLVETNRFGLIPFRSPLLWESRLISFPLGTEMFHFPRSAPKKVLGLLPVGFPIQTSTDHRIFSSSPRLIAAYHVFHRLQRQGIRPLLLITCFSRKKPLIISLFNCQRSNGRSSRSQTEIWFDIVRLLTAPLRLRLYQNMSGGGEGNRTHDPLRAKQMLSQLSYAPDNGGPGKT